jgi:hypothetical protein
MVFTSFVFGLDQLSIESKALNAKDAKDEDAKLANERRERSGGFTDKFGQPVAVAATGCQSRAVSKYDGIFAAKERAHFLNTLNDDDDGALNAQEPLRGKEGFGQSTLTIRGRSRRRLDLTGRDTTVCPSLFVLRTERETMIEAEL